MTREHSLEGIVRNPNAHSVRPDKLSIRSIIVTALIALGLVTGTGSSIKYFEQKNTKPIQYNSSYNTPLSEDYNNPTINRESIENRIKNTTIRIITLQSGQNIWNFGENYMKVVLGESKYDSLSKTRKEVLAQIYAEETLKMNNLTWKDAKNISTSQLIRLPELMYNPNSNIIYIITKDNKGKIGIYQTSP